VKPFLLNSVIYWSKITDQEQKVIKLTDNTMKAALFKKYGRENSISVEKMAIPAPKENEILIRVKATTVTAVDAIFRSGSDFFPRLATGIWKPKIKTLGTELTGIVESVGEKVTAFKIGDAIIADSGTNYGAHAEFITLSEDDPIVPKPEDISFNEASAISYGALTALSFLRDHGKIKQDDKVMVIGASGSVGTYAVQLARYFGAEVTAVCSSNNIDLINSLGADHVIDYKKTPLKSAQGQFDIIFDTVGKYNMGKLKHLIKADGKYLTTVLKWQSVLYMIRTAYGSRKSILAFTGLRSNEEKKKDLGLVSELYNIGKLRVIIDREFTLDRIAEAFDYVEKGHKTGNVVITF
jgi:NADPH:quinone reductase-like Zn-dependent oxidoreductase